MKNTSTLVFASSTLMWRCTTPLTPFSPSRSIAWRAWEWER
jgi:hypothetical protein